MPMVVRRKGRMGYTVKTVYRLVYWVYRRIQKLASEKREVYHVSSRLKITLSYARGSTSKYPATGRLKTLKWKIPLTVDKREDLLFIKFWHELDRRTTKLRVTEVCKTIPRWRYFGAKCVGIEACRFKRKAIPRWVDDIDPKECERTLSQMDKHGDLDPNMILKPLTDFEKVLFSTDYPKKIPIKITSKSVKSKHKFVPVAKKVRTVSIVDSSTWQGFEIPDHSKLRQTRIEEHFGPRSSMMKKIATLSKNG